MERITRLEKDRRAAYHIVLSTPAGRDLLEDLIQFAIGTTDPMIRIGRADVVLRILREKSRLKEPQEDLSQANTD